MQQPPRPPDDGASMDPTIAIPRIEAPPPRPADSPAVAVPVSWTPVPPNAYGTPPYATSPAIVAPAATIAPEPPRYLFGNPFAYTAARFVACAVDLGLVTIVVTALVYALFAINPLTGLPTNSERGFDTTLAIGAGIAFVYVWVAEAIFGTTIGKLALALHVYARRGRFVGFGRSFVRSLLRPIDLLVIGGILALLPGHRRLGDLLGGTVVARSPLRSFAPLVGWILIIALVGLPFLFVPVDRLLAGLVAFGEFVPPLIGKLWNLAASLFAGASPPLH